MSVAKLYFSTKKIKSASLGEPSPLPDLSGEHILQNDLIFCLDEDDEIYEGYGRCKNAYPYRQYNNYTNDLEEKEVKTAVLENEHVRAVFLPEFGGRLWELWDKRREENILYTNDVLKFHNLAVRNAWFSGGVEWNIGVIGHTPLTTEQMYAARLTDDSGNPVLRMYEYERIRKAAYQMDFRLDGDRLCCRMRIVNGSADVIPMYWWSNIAVPEYENGRVIVPADKAFTFQDGRVLKVDIPMVNGIDVTAYKNIPKSVDYFFDIPEGSPKYIANVNEEGYGLLHVSTGRLRSRKLFSWGSTQASDHWQELLTDKAGRYIEIQAGLAKTQYGCLPMAPHTAWEWAEEYGPVQIAPEILGKPHKERAAFLSQKLTESQIPQKLEEKCQAMKKLAKTAAEPVINGSGFGALRPYTMGTEHLKFELSEPGLLAWKRFLDGGKLERPDVSEQPGAFCVDQKNYVLLKKAVEGNEADNWYAWYLLGIGYYTDGRHEDAENAFRTSWQLEKNPWAAHGCSSALLVSGWCEEAAAWMEKGIQMRKRDLSYLKDGFKLLLEAEAFSVLCHLYEQLEEKEKKNGRLKFGYICALHALGEDERAYHLLEEDGGLFVEDIREGEDSVAQLWSELYEAVSGRKQEVPKRYDFKAY